MRFILLSANFRTERQTKAKRRRLYSEGDEEDIYERPRRPQIEIESPQPPSREMTNESSGVEVEVEADAGPRAADGHVVVHGMPVSRASSSIDVEEDERPTNRTEDENEPRGAAMRAVHAMPKANPNEVPVPPLQLSSDGRAFASPSSREERSASRKEALSPAGRQENRSCVSGLNGSESGRREASGRPENASETQRDADGGTSWRALDPMVMRPELSARPDSASRRPPARENGALSPGVVSLRSSAQERSLTPVGQ